MQANIKTHCFAICCSMEVFLCPSIYHRFSGFEMIAVSGQLPDSGKLFRQIHATNQNVSIKREEIL